MLCIILSYNDIRGWYQSNPCIPHGYHPMQNSTHAGFASWLYLHDEFSVYIRIFTRISVSGGEKYDLPILSSMISQRYDYRLCFIFILP